jgi:probable HAF family extracellular repeat protein
MARKGTIGKTNQTGCAWRRPRGLASALAAAGLLVSLTASAPAAWAQPAQARWNVESVGRWTLAYGLNNLGDVVGYAYDDFGEPRAFLFGNGVFATLDLGRCTAARPAPSPSTTAAASSPSPSATTPPATTRC